MWTILDYIIDPHYNMTKIRTKNDFFKLINFSKHSTNKNKTITKWSLGRKKSMAAKSEVDCSCVILFGPPYSVCHA